MIKKTLPYIIMAILLMVVINMYCGMNRLKNNYQQNLAASHDTIKTQHDRYGRIMQEKKAYEISTKELKYLNDSLREAIKNIKPEIIVKYKTVYKDTGSIKIKYDTIIPFDFKRNITYKDKWSKFDATITNEDFILRNREYYNEQYVVFGEAGRLFEKKYITVRIVNTNPNIQVTNLNSYKIRKNKKLTDRKWFWGIIGFVAGILIN